MNTEEEQKKIEEERKKLYSELRAELFKRQLSNAENYDKAILSLATAVLGFSLVFLKDIASIANAKEVWILQISWFFLALTIVSTLSSFFTSQAGISKQLKYAER